MVKVAKDPDRFVMVASHRAASFSLTNDGIVPGLALTNYVSEASLWNVIWNNVEDVTLACGVRHAAVDAVLKVPDVVAAAAAVTVRV